MWRLKGCPRCKGDLCLDIQVKPVEWMCLQCGCRPYEYQVAQIEPESFISGRMPAPSGYGVIQDSGCKEHSSCLRCPLPQCQNDVSEQIALLRRNGMGMEDLAQRFNMPVARVKGVVSSMSRALVTGVPRRQETGGGRISRGQALRRPA